MPSTWNKIKSSLDVRGQSLPDTLNLLAGLQQSWTTAEFVSEIINLHEAPVGLTVTILVLEDWGSDKVHS